jgi:hypothetical protein
VSLLITIQKKIRSIKNGQYSLTIQQLLPNGMGYTTNAFRSHTDDWYPLTAFAVRQPRLDREIPNSISGSAERIYKNRRARTEIYEQHL